MAGLCQQGVGVEIERIGGTAPWESAYGYCRVVRAAGWALTAGTTATGPDGVLHPGDPYRQAIAAFGIALDALAAAGVPRDGVVRTRMYVVGAEHQPEVGRAHRDTFRGQPPVATMVVVQALADPRHLVEVEVEAVEQGPADQGAVPQTPAEQAAVEQGPAGRGVGR